MTHNEFVAGRNGAPKNVISILAWNLNHRATMKVVPPAVTVAIKNLGADIVVLNEYTDGERREYFKSSLEEIGYGSLIVSTKLGRENQVLIASRMPIEHGEITAPGFDDSARTNFLHVLAPEWGLDIVGVRCPAYKRRKDLSLYWSELQTIMSAAAERRAVFIGDFNGDPDRPKTPAGRHLAGLRRKGWAVPSPAGEWSYISHDARRRSRLDFVAATPSTKILTASYIHEVLGIVLAGPAESKPISDHAALLTSIDLLPTHG